MDGARCCETHEFSIISWLGISNPFSRILLDDIINEVSDEAYAYVSTEYFDEAEK